MAIRLHEIDQAAIVGQLGRVSSEVASAEFYVSDGASLLSKILAAFGELDCACDDAVISCRAVGMTWAEVGKSLGVSRQAAWERFSKRLTI